MIPHRILVPVAYLTPVQCFLFAWLLRSLAPPRSLWLPLAGFGGIAAGLLLSVLEIVLLGAIFDRRIRRTTRTTQDARNKEKKIHPH